MASVGDSHDLNGTRQLAREIARNYRGNAGAQNAAAWALLIYGNPNAKEALHLVRPVAVGCKDSSTLDTYAWALYLSGNRREAIRQEKLALKHVDARLDAEEYYRPCLTGFEGD